MLSGTMNELAELATTELLQQEIDALKLEIESLQCELLESKEHCRRLEEEASLQLGIERLLDETDDEFKKRKQSIYNRRSYKRGKKSGSAQEENARLITELESIRGKLIISEERCERLAAEGSLQIVERLPGETDEQLSKRREQIYNQRSYIKRKKKLRVEKGSDIAGSGVIGT
jgi:hypothetical protein